MEVLGVQFEGQGMGGCSGTGGVFPSAKAKNSENQGEYHDIVDAMIHLRGRKVNTSKRITTE